MTRLNNKPTWSNIETVLLDMDGTLLDLHFDTHFWQDLVPERYALSRGLDIITAKQLLTHRFKQSEGTLDWYCIDYWTKQLDLDIALLKEEVAELITLKPHAEEFLTKLRKLNKRVILVTNAHQKSLALKLKKTRLDAYLDAIICAHDLGHPKEETSFWIKLQEHESYDTPSTLLIDDNLTALRAARRFGIHHLLAARRPSSKAPPIFTDEFDSFEDFREIMPDQAQTGTSV